MLRRPSTLCGQVFMTTSSINISLFFMSTAQPFLKLNIHHFIYHFWIKISLFATELTSSGSLVNLNIRNAIFCTIKQPLC